jgi:anti-repressor protein
MSQEIVPQVFENKEFGQLRVTQDENGEPWFVIADLCKALDLSNPTMVASRLNEDDLSTTEVTDSLGRKQKANTTNEGGMYEVVFMSRKPEAKRFKRWVTHDVLPAIRRDGGYMVARDGETPQETMARALLIAQETINRKDSTIAAQRDTIRELSPKAAFFDAVGDSDGKMSVADLSKALRQAGIQMGQNRLFKWFRDNGYMGKRGIHRNRPTQRAIEQGLFYLHDTTFVRRDGKVFNSFTPMVTAKGATVFFKAISKQLQMSIEL